MFDPTPTTLDLSNLEVSVHSRNGIAHGAVLGLPALRSDQDQDEVLRQMMVHAIDGGIKITGAFLFTGVNGATVRFYAKFDHRNRHLLSLATALTALLRNWVVNHSEHFVE